jgi:hypothetical protein
MLRFSTTSAPCPSRAFADGLQGEFQTQSGPQDYEMLNQFRFGKSQNAKSVSQSVFKISQKVACAKWFEFVSQSHTRAIATSAKSSAGSRARQASSSVYLWRRFVAHLPADDRKVLHEMIAGAQKNHSGDDRAILKNSTD